MALDTKILTLVKPAIQLEELAILDTETQDNQGVSQDTAFKKSETVGKVYPLIKIEGYSFANQSISKLELQESQFLPTITASLIDQSGSFSSNYFPKTNPIMSVYIKPDNDKFKPIRNDYLITSITQTPSSDPSLRSTGRGSVIRVTGMLYVPYFMNREFKSYKDKSSYDALMTIAKYLKIGFATNEVSTNDSMTWLQPYTNYYSAINHIVTHSYKDDDSFYNTFIDKYYTLNFINVKNMFSEEFDFDKTWPSLTAISNNLASDKSAETDEVHDLFLSNWSTLKGSTLWISSYTPITQQGAALASGGYIKRISYYDTYYDTKDYSKCFLEWKVKPIGIVTPDQKKFPDINESNDGEWNGVDYNNNHANYKHSYYMNEHYLIELNKMKLVVRMDGINFNVIRGSRVPVIIILEGKDHMLQQDAEVPLDAEATDEEKLKDKAQENLKVDEYLTGFYMVYSIKYVYQPGSGERASFYTEMELVKNKWDQKSPELGRDINTNTQ